jgi:hypothetical protein
MEIHQLVSDWGINEPVPHNENLYFDMNEIKLEPDNYLGENLKD